MSRRVVITGLGPVSGLGIGIDATWDAVCRGESAIAPITAFDPTGFACRIAAQAPPFKISDYVPKTYRKATKVMARDIELAVIAADRAARDATLVTKGTAGDADAVSYEPQRMGCHIGAGLIAADVDELTSALVEARAAEGSHGGDFDIRKWGNHGMQHLTPLWLLKYLPNMLACHVTIIHDTQGPSNTITVGEASSGLSIGESLRVIQRGAADLCFCGGAESKLNPMAYLRQQIAGRLTDRGDTAAAALRPFDADASGTVLGEGGGILVLESAETFHKRGAGRAYAEVAGFGASQSVHRESRNHAPDPLGRGMAGAMQQAMREAGVGPGDIDMVVPFGSGLPAWDQSELAGLRRVFGDRLADIHVAALKPLVGNCGAGAGGLEIAIAARALAEQTVPPILNRESPLDGLRTARPEPQPAKLRCILTFSASYTGQNTALVLKRV
jgi:3-oxoacyl-[acyl-carrier-protein] synthase II